MEIGKFGTNTRKYNITEQIGQSKALNKGLQGNRKKRQVGDEWKLENRRIVEWLEKLEEKRKARL